MSPHISLPSIPEYFSGKTVFVTGGFGFIGKVLVEKLLRSCPEIQTIYLLARAKRGKTPEERLKKMWNLALFELVRRDHPDSLSKLKLIEGNLSELRLGLKEDDRKRLIEETNIVFHGAASVRFNDTLKAAVLLNTRGAREIANLVLAMKNVEVMVHVSTTYCNCDRDVVMEELYPPHADWEQTIKICEDADEQLLNILTTKYMDRLPNSYTFSKSLAEHVINDMLVGKVPVVCGRPSIVVASFEEPFPGWVDTFNGPYGMMAASGKGILRSVLMEDLKSIMIPVDVVAKNLISIAWKKAVIDKNNDKMEVYIFNYDNIDFRVSDFIKIARKVTLEKPLSGIVWYPEGTPTNSPLLHYIRVILYHLLPAIFVDIILKLSGRQPMLTKLQRKIYVANNSLVYFSIRQWTFDSRKTCEVKKFMKPEDLETFWFKEDLDLEVDMLRVPYMGFRRHLMKDPDSTIESARKHLFRMWILYIATKLLAYLGLFWLIFFKFGLLSIMVQKYQNVLMYFTKD